MTLAVQFVEDVEEVIWEIDWVVAKVTFCWVVVKVTSFYGWMVQSILIWVRIDYLIWVVGDTCGYCYLMWS